MTWNSPSETRWLSPSSFHLLPSTTVVTVSSDLREVRWVNRLLVLCLGKHFGSTCCSRASAEQQAWAGARAAVGKSCPSFLHRWVTVWVLLRAKAFDCGKGLVIAQLLGGRVNTALGAGWAPLLGSRSTVCRAAWCQAGVWALSCSRPGRPLEPSPLRSCWQCCDPPAGLCPTSLRPFERAGVQGSQQMNHAERWENGNASRTEICRVCLVHGNTEGIHLFDGEYFGGAQNCCLISSEGYH